MGKKAKEARQETIRRVRDERLTPAERDFLREKAAYEGSPHHKRNPGDFKLTPPSAPRPDKTLCDEAQLFNRALAEALFERAIDHGLVSEPEGAPGFPKQLWVIDASGRVFEIMYGGAQPGRYHGYPIRRGDPFFDIVSRAWGA